MASSASPIGTAAGRRLEIFPPYLRIVPIYSVTGVYDPPLNRQRNSEDRVGLRLRIRFTGFCFLKAPAN